MAYTPTEWVSGTIISASKLNNIERGVESVNSEYTPTTWAEGDTVTAAKLNKIEQGIADASGGGSSDFSTAEVILTINGDGVSIWGACLYDNPQYPSDTGSYGSISESEPNIVILYKGKACLTPPSLTGREVSTTGGVIFDPVSENFIVTGNGTITIS